MEHDNIKQIPTAVYHYSASTTLHGRLFDGVIERPIIFSADCYQQVRREIASRIGANVHQVQVHSLSFIGESTPAASNKAPAVEFVGPVGQTDEVITWPQRKMTITATHQAAGDNRFWPMVAEAIKECWEKDPMGCEEDFAASNGVLLRFSWPGEIVVGGGAA